MNAASKVFTLLDVMQSVQRTLHTRYTASFWVKAEMNKLNYYVQSGHCYPELVEKREGKVVAQIRASLWKDDYSKINDKFLHVLNEPLKDGTVILFCARIVFDAMHGLSLRIIDIDPGYTMGALQEEKRQTIERLKQENLFDKNKKLQLALLPQRIAVISVTSSKGYADFIKTINDNNYKYNYFTMLFPALLQGEKAVESIVVQLDKIRKVIRHFDAVAIVRGGGGDVGLSCYNNYELVRKIASFPIPVITGIGHATNETAAELVSFKNAITPTHLANFLIEQFHAFARPVKRATEVISKHSQRMLNENKFKVLHTAQLLSLRSSLLLKTATYNYTAVCKNIITHTALRIKAEKKIINDLSVRVDFWAPQNVLKRGYSITTLNGQPLQSAQDIKEGDVLKTVVQDGEIMSKVFNQSTF